MLYVIKKANFFVGNNNALVEHFNQARFFNTREQARQARSYGGRIWRVRVKPVSFEKVR